MVDICHDKIIWLDPRAPRVRKKFKRLIALARRQIQLQGDHEGGAVKFLEDIKSTCELPPTAGGPPADEGLRARTGRPARQEAKANCARRPSARNGALEHERQLILAARTADAPEPAPYSDVETEESGVSNGWG